jgi:hypothetical protein
MTEDDRLLIELNKHRLERELGTQLTFSATHRIMMAEWQRLTGLTLETLKDRFPQLPEAA